jgi:hypothetical protein
MKNGEKWERERERGIFAFTYNSPHTNSEWTKSRKIYTEPEGNEDLARKASRSTCQD